MLDSTLLTACGTALVLHLTSGLIHNPTYTTNSCATITYMIRGGRALRNILGVRTVIIKLLNFPRILDRLRKLKVDPLPKRFGFRVLFSETGNGDQQVNVLVCF